MTDITAQVSEHFLWHTRQSGRPLSEQDMRMLLWLKRVYVARDTHAHFPYGPHLRHMQIGIRHVTSCRYCGEEPAVCDGRPQKLPYEVPSFASFFKHLFGASRRGAF